MRWTMKKLMMAVMTMILSISAIFCFAGCSVLEGILGKEDSAEDFDRTPYVGTYYFSSYTYVNEEYEIYNLHYEVGKGYSKDYITLELKSDGHYEWRSETNISGNMSGEWKKGYSENKFEFYENGQSIFSAEIVDGTFTRVEKDSYLTSPTKIYTWVLVKE